MRKKPKICSASAPLIMGILNVTPDSFSDGGLYLSPSAMLERARAMVRDGADIIDIGAESTRPGRAETGEGEELSRLIPAICAVRAEFPDVPISADTRRPSVAARAAEAGADIINDVVSDISGGYPMAKAAAEAGLPLVITHNIRGIQNEGDFFENFISDMRSKISAALDAGVERDCVILDPGIGFGKTPRQNAELVARLAELRALGFPVLLGVSRKSMFSPIVGDDFSDRDDATMAAGVFAVLQNSADILRVHDVKRNANAVKTAVALKNLWTK